MYFSTRKKGIMTEQYTDTDRKLTKKIQPYKIIYPVLIGVVVVGYMLYKEFDPKAFDLVTFTWNTIFWLVVAVMCMVMRDFGYILRIRILSDNHLSWSQAFRIIMLWEFTSAVTPSVVGGTSFAILFVHKEGIGIGKSSAMVMATSLLDELYFIIMFPLILLSVNQVQLWEMSGSSQVVVQSLKTLAIVGYLLKLVYLIILSYGLFKNPRSLKYIIMKLFKWRILRKWRHDANEAGTDIIRNSKELRMKPFIFWFKTFGTTFLSWTSRYWLVNAILVAFWFGNYDWGQHILIFARQLVMWIMMLVTPTPGGSGFAEFIFTEYLGNFLPGAGLAVALAILWRLISYYSYLLIGIFIVPRWIARNFGKSKK